MNRVKNSIHIAGVVGTDYTFIESKFKYININNIIKLNKQYTTSKNSVEFKHTKYLWKILYKLPDNFIIIGNIETFDNNEIIFPTIKFRKNIFLNVDFKTYLENLNKCNTNKYMKKYYSMGKLHPVSKRNIKIIYDAQREVYKKKGYIFIKPKDMVKYIKSI